MTGRCELCGAPCGHCQASGRAEIAKIEMSDYAIDVIDMVTGGIIKSLAPKQAAKHFVAELLRGQQIVSSECVYRLAK